MAQRSIEAVRAAATAAEPPPDFRTALEPRTKKQPALIAEIKHRSPSRGVLAADFRPLSLAETYVENGAAAISVLTDEHYFGGSLSVLRQVSARLADLPVRVPALLKDFVYSEYQVLEAVEAGASAVLLIAAMLRDRELVHLIDITQKSGLCPLVEVHNRAEARRALEAGADVIGINNRDLHTFQVDLETTLTLRPYLPEDILVVAESGIRTAEDVRKLADAGVAAMLIGESIVTAPDPGAAVRYFSGGRS